MASSGEAIPPGWDQPNVPTPLDVMLQQLNANCVGGMSVQVKRRCNDGSLIDASANQLSTLSTKSRVATAAQALKELPPAERTAWAIEMKDYANELYATNQTRDAMEKYVEALAASNFGADLPPLLSSPAVSAAADSVEADSPENSNIDVLVIPILCNLASCCILLQEFSKAQAFADQALALRPLCGKALMRRGIALLQHGEYAKAATSLTRALELREDAPGAVLVVSEGDRQRIPILLGRTQQGLEAEQKAVARQKRSLEKYFGRHSSAAAGAGAGAGGGGGEAGVVRGDGDVKGVGEGGIVARLWRWLYILLMWLLAQIGGAKNKKD